MRACAPGAGSFRIRSSPASPKPFEHEQLTAQFVGDLSALDRMEALAEQLGQLDASSARTVLIQAQIASMLHRFSDARHYLAQAELGGAPSARCASACA